MIFLGFWGFKGFLGLRHPFLRLLVSLQAFFLGPAKNSSTRTLLLSFSGGQVLDHLSDALIPPSWSAHRGQGLLPATAGVRGYVAARTSAPYLHSRRHQPATVQGEICACTGILHPIADAGARQKSLL